MSYSRSPFIDRSIQSRSPIHLRKDSNGITRNNQQTYSRKDSFGVSRKDSYGLLMKDSADISRNDNFGVSRKDSFGSNYFIPRKLSTGLKGKQLTQSRRGSNVSLPRIEANAGNTSFNAGTSHSHYAKKCYLRGRGTADGQAQQSKKLARRYRPTIDDLDEENLRSLTPQPEVFQEFKIFKNGVAVLTAEQKTFSDFRPRYCWCMRCQLMYSMYKHRDPYLKYWGKYPCHQR